VTVVGVALLLVGATGLFVPALGQEESAGEGVGGFDTDARAAATRQIFTPENNILPTENLIEVSNPYAATQLSGGPSGHALAAMFWPGDTFANACGAFPGGIPDENQAPDYPEQLPRVPVPCWEERAESFSPPAEGQSPTVQKSSFGGSLTSRAEGTDVSALAQFDPQGAQGFSVGPESAESKGTIDKGLLVAEATSKLSDIVIGGPGGLVIKGLVSTAKATSDGTKAEVTGGTTIFGATLGGVPVTIDENGITVQEQSSGPLGGVLDQLKPVLDQLAITAKLTTPVKTVEGAGGEIVTTGLVVTLDNAPYLANLPPELKGQLPVDVTGRTTLVFGQASAKAAATPGFGEFTEDEPVVEEPPADTGGDVSVAGDSLGTDTGFAAPVSGQVSATETSVTQPVATTRSLPDGTAVSLGLVILALVGTGLAAFGLNKLATGVFEPVVGTNCPLESG
jgi:hypothetical protein